MNYSTQAWSEADLADIDAGNGANGIPLAAMGKKPETADALLRVRAFKTREEWQRLCQEGGYDDATRAMIGHVWRTMPGYTCEHDALRLIAYGPRIQ